VVGVDDEYVDGGKNYTIKTEILDADASYSNYNPPDLPMTNLDDNDTPGLVITPTDGLVTSESGTTATFQVQLAKPPAPTTQVALSAVALPPAADLPLEGSVGLPDTQLIFNSENYNVPQTVTVTGIDDNIIDCSMAYEVSISIDRDNTTSGPYLNSDIIGTVSVTNTDNEAATSPQIIISKTQLNTSEDGASDSFNVCLTTQPTAPVTINVAIPQTSANEGAFSGGFISRNIVIDQNNWPEVHTYTITGKDDAVSDGPQTYNLVISLPLSNDTNYANRAIPAISVTNADNEEPCKNTSHPYEPGLCIETTSIDTSEDGGSGELKVRLTKKPTKPVVVKVTVTDTSEGRIADPVNNQLFTQRLVFDQYNWSIERSLTIIGLDDGEDDGNIIYPLQLDTSESTAAEYLNIALPEVSVTNRDNDRTKPAKPGSGGALSPGLLCLLIVLLVLRYRYRFDNQRYFA
jgi:hypothetical protein